MKGRKLSPRKPRFSASLRKRYPLARSFHAIQRDHLKQPMPERRES